MTFSGLGMLVALGAVIGLVVYAAISRGRMTVLHSIWAVLFGALGAYGGSELFGFVSESGPEASEAHPIPAIIGAVLMSGALTVGILRRWSDTREVETVPESGLAHFLFNDPRAAVLWLGVRLFVGWQWFESGWNKVRDSAWMDGGSQLRDFWTRAVEVPEPPAQPMISYTWYRDFISYMLEHGWYSWFAKLVAIGELLVGVALILGAFVGIAAFVGMFMNFNYMLAGSTSSNPFLFTLGVLLILAWKIAGCYGFDRVLRHGWAERHGKRPAWRDRWFDRPRSPA
jgi:thiosulfate dehydrogenase [quinone] large subunit